jgi:hypothetical protein
VEETSGVERDDENNASSAGNHNDTPYSLTHNTSNAENSCSKPIPIAMTMDSGSDYNHLDYDQKPGKTQQQAATLNNDYNHTKTTGLNSEGLLGAYTYSLASNPDGNCQNNTTEEDYQNIAICNSAVYQESLNAAGGMYHIIDEEPGYVGESVRSYNVPDDVDEDVVKDVLVEEDEDLQGLSSASLYSQGDASLSVYHLPDETLKCSPNAKHASVTYYNLQGPIAAAGTSTDATAAVNSAASEISQACKPHVMKGSSTGIPHVAGETLNKPHARRLRKPRTKPKPNQNGAPPTPTKPKPSPSSAFQVSELSGKPSNNVYHILEPQDHEALDDYSDGSNVIVVQSSGAGNNTMPPSKDVLDDEYNSLSFEGKKGNLKTKVVKSGSDNADDAAAVYNHLNGADEDAYNQIDRERKVQCIDGEYWHLQQQ